MAGRARNNKECRTFWDSTENRHHEHRLSYQVPDVFGCGSAGHRVPAPFALDCRAEVGLDLNGPRGHEPAILHLCRGRVEAKPSRADAVEKGQEHKWLADVAVRSAAALNDCPRPDDGRDVPRLVKVNNPVGGPVKGSQGSPIGECFGQDLGRPKIASPDGGRVRERGGPPLLVDNGAHAVVEKV